MKTEFRQAEIPRELRALVAFDRKVFPSDYFPASEWRHYESWWLLVDGRKIGCCAFDPECDKSLYIASTGILPRFQHQGFGRLMKAWQIAYARRHRFARIVIHTRKSNAPMIALNREFGFRALRTIPRYYAGPTEAAVVMELKLR